MKLGPVTKVDKRNKTMSKKLDVDVIIVFRIFDNRSTPDAGFGIQSLQQLRFQ